MRASRLDEKSLNYGQLNAALVGAVKSLKSQDSGGGWETKARWIARGEWGKGGRPKWPGKALGR